MFTMLWLRDRESGKQTNGTLCAAFQNPLLLSCPWCDHAKTASCSPHPRIHSASSEAGSAQALMRKQGFHPPLILIS